MNGEWRIGSGMNGISIEYFLKIEDIIRHQLRTVWVISDTSFASKIITLKTNQFPLPRQQAAISGKRCVTKEKRSIPQLRY